MGFFSWFKNLFSKTIHGSKSGRELVYLATKSTIKIGQDIEVKPGYTGVVVAKGVVCDVFPEGRHRLEPKELPLASRKLKLTRQSRKGELPDRFKADIYFVNLGEFTGNFKSKDFVKSNGDGYKKLKSKLSGEYIFSVVNPIDFLEALLTQTGVIVDDIAQDEISEWVATLCVKCVQKNRPTVEDIFKLNRNCFVGLKEKINSELYDCGIRIEDVVITKSLFERKVQKDLIIKYSIRDEERIENPVQLLNERQFERNSNEIFFEEANRIENEMSNGTYAINDKGVNQIDNSQPYLNNQNWNNDRQDIPIQKTVSYKKCPFCDAINSVSSESCFSCGKRFL